MKGDTSCCLDGRQKSCEEEEAGSPRGRFTAFGNNNDEFFGYMRACERPCVRTCMSENVRACLRANERVW